MSELMKNFKDFIQKFHEESQLNKNRGFEFLKRLALYNSTNAIRYNAIKLLHKFYPNESSELIKWCLSHDSNYDIPIINLDNKRHNINDLVNFAIKKKHSRDQMVDHTMKNDLLLFVISWKEEYITENFKVIYHIPLKSFIFLPKRINLIIYLFDNVADSFSYLKTIEKITFSALHHHTELSHCSLSLYELLKNIIKVPKNNLKCFILDNGMSSNLPKYKVIVEKKKLIFYL